MQPMAISCPASQRHPPSAAPEVVSAGLRLTNLRRALLGFDTRPDFARIKAKVRYILCRTDALFPPKIARDARVPGAIGRPTEALRRRRLAATCGERQPR
jgi:hypothetical protein